MQGVGNVLSKISQEITICILQFLRVTNFILKVSLSSMSSPPKSCLTILSCTNTSLLALHCTCGGRYNEKPHEQRVSTSFPLINQIFFFKRTLGVDLPEVIIIVAYEYKATELFSP